MSGPRVLRPWFDPRRVVFEDEDLIAVDKPEGVSSQAADPAHPDDVVFRLGGLLAERDGRERPYLGVHQRLDQDTSGVLLYAKRKEANAGLARQLEGRLADKRYVALVTGWRGEERRLEHRLARGKDGRSHVAPRDPRAQRAVSFVRVLEREGERALLEVRIETGRTHQIRAQLAAEGAPVLGDRLYGGAPAARLMLHAASIGLTHPVRQTPLAIEAPLPPLLARALRGDDDEPLCDVLARAAERRWGFAHREGLSAYRLVHEEGDAAPGLAVDVYDEWLVAHFYSRSIEDRSDEVLDALEALGVRGVYVKHRPKQASVIGDAKDEAYAPSLPARGEPAPDPLVIWEGGLPFEVRLGEGLSTGVFLDQRDNRRRVRELAAGARVLNLFSYTCAFTVAAAAGGASDTLSVDASSRALSWGQDNLERAGLASSAHRFEVADVFDTLARLAREGARFDLICVDPPTYSTTRSSRWTSGSDWRRLAAAALAVLAPGGRLLACSNDRRLHGQKLRRYLHEAARDAGVTLAQLKDLACPSDFPPPFGGEPHLKSVLATSVSP